MRWRKSFLVWSLVLSAGILIGLFAARQPAAAQLQNQDVFFTHVQVVTFPTGLTGFFDRRTGTLFLYDVNLDQPVVVRQIDALGKPLIRLKN